VAKPFRFIQLINVDSICVLHLRIIQEHDTVIYAFRNVYLCNIYPLFH
jgi:hypothetical protein